MPILPTRWGLRNEWNCRGSLRIHLSLLDYSQTPCTSMWGSTTSEGSKKSFGSVELYVPLQQCRESQHPSQKPGLSIPMRCSNRNINPQARHPLHSSSMVLLPYEGWLCCWKLHRVAYDCSYSAVSTTGTNRDKGGSETHQNLLCGSSILNWTTTKKK